MEGDSATAAERAAYDCSFQAIAKAETVSGNAARLGRSVHLCLCKTPGQDRLAALLLLVPERASAARLRGSRSSREGLPPVTRRARD